MFVVVDVVQFDFFVFVYVGGVEEVFVDVVGVFVVEIGLGDCCVVQFGVKYVVLYEVFFEIEMKLLLVIVLGCDVWQVVVFVFIWWCLWLWECVLFGWFD